MQSYFSGFLKGQIMHVSGALAFLSMESELEVAVKKYHINQTSLLCEQHISIVVFGELNILINSQFY